MLWCWWCVRSPLPMTLTVCHLCGAGAAAKPGLDRRRVGRIREQPPRQVLHHHPFRPETACRGNLLLAAPLRGHWARARALGGRPEMNAGVLWARLKGLMRRREFDEELQKEIAAHLELATAENLRRGMPPIRTTISAAGNGTCWSGGHRKRRPPPK